MHTQKNVNELKVVGRLAVTRSYGIINRKVMGVIVVNFISFYFRDSPILGAVLF